VRHYPKNIIKYVTNKKMEKEASLSLFRFPPDRKKNCLSRPTYFNFSRSGTILIKSLTREKTGETCHTFWSPSFFFSRYYHTNHQKQRLAKSSVLFVFSFFIFVVVVVVATPVVHTFRRRRPAVPRTSACTCPPPSLMHPPCRPCRSPLVCPSSGRSPSRE